MPQTTRPGASSASERKTFAVMPGWRVSGFVTAEPTRSRVVAWSHGSRFALARRLVAPAAGGRLLDYGCGDGTFVAMVHQQFRETRGVDVEPTQLAECRVRLGRLPGVSRSSG